MSGYKRPARPIRRKYPETDDFVRVSRSTIGTLQHFIIRVGTAILGGDFTGNVRGAQAIDLTTERTAGGGGVTQVASGDYAVQIGALNTVSGTYGVRVGYSGAVSGESGVGIGNNASASGASAVAVGLNSNAQGDNSVALAGADMRTAGSLGLGTTAKLINAAYAFNTGVPPIVKRAAGLGAQANWPLHLAGPLTVFTSGLIDLKSATFYTLDLSAGQKLLILSMGLLCVSVSGLTVQPTIKFGATFADSKYVASRQTTQLTAANKREVYLPETLSDYETDPNFTVVTGATATAMSGRVYWVGVLLEDE